MYNSFPITAVAGELSRVCGITPPVGAVEIKTPISLLAERAFEGGKASKLFVFNPDAVASWLFFKYTGFFEPVFENTQLSVPMLSVFPSVTPVCFASMYSGLTPDKHGIKQYEKPIINSDTFFDALIRAGKKVAIVAHPSSSIGTIFKGRELDYFYGETDSEINSIATELLMENAHDVYIVYNCDYDSHMHHSTTESETSLKALKSNLDSFGALARIAREANKDENLFIAFCTDHGVHMGDNGYGTHGSIIEDDMNIFHFFGAFPKR